MSSHAPRDVMPSIPLVVKRLARDWRAAGKNVDNNIPDSERVKNYLAHPMFALLRLIGEATSFPIADLEWAAYYADRPLERTPPKPPGDAFFRPDPERKILGLPEHFATGTILAHLRLIHNELKKCDEDGRTEVILQQLEAKYPGVLKAQVAGNREKTLDGNRHKGNEKRRQRTGASRGQSRPAASRRPTKTQSTPPIRRPGIRPSREDRKKAIFALVKELGKDSCGRHASVKKIIKEMRIRGIRQRPTTTREILRELKDEGKYVGLN